MFLRLVKALIFVAALAASAPAFAQTSEDSKPCNQSPVLAHDISKPGGWDTGFIDSLKILTPESALKSPDPIYSGVTSVQLGLKDKKFDFQTVRLSNCSRNVTIEETQMSVYRVFAFKKNNQTFAYLLSGEIQSRVKDKWQSCACGGELLLYDPDGTGVFSHLILYSSPLPYVPDWVRRVAHPYPRNPSGCPTLPQKGGTNHRQRCSCLCLSPARAHPTHHKSSKIILQSRPFFPTLSALG